MHRESHTRPAPSEFPQGLTAARVGGRSGAMYQAFPFFIYMTHTDILIIGGGAAGLFALRGLKEKKVCIIEGNSKLGLKLLATGGGKCNFTNLYLAPDNFVCSNPHFMKSFLAKFGTYDFLDIIEAHNIPYEEVRSLEAVMPQLDFLYMTRVQKERFFNEEDYLRLKDSYILTPEKMAAGKPTMRVLHPLPRVNEISVKVDDDPRAAYFRQALNGKYMRMALILKLLKEAEEGKQMPPLGDVMVNELVCDNPRCISSVEQELDHIFVLTDREQQTYRCFYCEAQSK